MYDSYGFGPLENQLIYALRHQIPDFVKAKHLLRQGANLNAIHSERSNESLLSATLFAYWYSVYGHADECLNEQIEAFTYLDMTEQAGKNMVSIIRFYLDNGFDINRNEGLVGAECLAALATSVYHQSIIPAGRLLLDAGAKNLHLENRDEPPLDTIGSEEAYHSMNAMYHHANMFEALYQMVKTAGEGKPYQGIDFYTRCIGKRILAIESEITLDGPGLQLVGTIEPNSKCTYFESLYLVHEDGRLAADKYGGAWTDNTVPPSPREDLSHRFPMIIGAQIQDVHTHAIPEEASYGTTQRPETTLLLDSGYKLIITTNYRQTNEEHITGYVFLR